ncbi:major facilitator superfamily domain-containing protein 10 [Zootermopsis nevadensis]|uniref:Major facilitator superfamily domain-containing protein 10 n=1 Tax=Zootermopsis nevadensis TaxID=136037 RepID=A0A067RGV1_ZOONE|nr:major facilitator superfamily domain-containing protein 10 [Zootermopsis nevadensis]KDR23002.1 Major facilitator superfamily domain-containing protein 10 [Zootermopsis nevadensis]
MVQTCSASGQLRTTHITYTRSDNGEAETDIQSGTIPQNRTEITCTTTKSTTVRRKVTTTSELNGSPVSSNSTGSLRTHPTVYIVFVSLLLDLLAFTMILPLLPSLLDHYRINDSPNGLYPWLLGKVRYFQEFVGAPDRFNSVLFGGFLGSMFSFLQFVASPLVGGLSDVYGRKPIMLLCLFGIAFSYVMWALSKNFALFVLARVIGGISKGNVSLSMAVIADVSSLATRGRGMALVGIAFSVGFIVGPVIGAMFAHWSHGQSGNWFVVPALFALGLALTDVAFVLVCFKETLPKEKRAKSVAGSLGQAASYISLPDLFRFKAVKNISRSDLVELQQLGFIYFVYLFLYSGLEFTLTFLTHHTFNYTSMQQGWMFFVIGLTMAVMQGGYVRRLPEHKIKPTAVLGLLLIVPSFVCVGLASSPVLLYIGLLLFAVSTAMVVPCMTTLVSKLGSHDQKGTVMGIFRSLGALARAVGPIVASIGFWSIGSTVTYLLGGIALLWPWMMLRRTNIV